MKFLFVITFAFCLQALPSDDPKIDALSKSKAWLALLHFKPRIPWGGSRSLIDGPSYFFSPNGRFDPKAELLASLESFATNMRVGKLKLHPQCAFPERYRFLKHNLRLKMKDVDCPDFRAFIQRFRAKSVSLVFSTAFPHNPGSMFGHTFLKVNSGSRSDLIDYGVNVAAAVGNDENSFKYILYGLFGGYEAQFSTLRYYAKINEYSYSQSRDIWEYELSLSPEEIERALSNLWEIENNSYMKYFFFDENCSYIILSALEVAKPEWNLTHFPLYTIPADTIKKLMAIPGAVTNITFRPSLRKKLFNKYEVLTPIEKTQFKSIVSRESEIEEVQSPLVLESLSLYYHFKELQNTPTQRQILKRRSEIPDNISTMHRPSPPISEDTRPDLGHGSYRLGIASGFQISKSTPVFYDLHFRTAYHDLMNNDLGYPPFSEVSFPSLTIRFLPASENLSLESLTILNVVSLSPIGFFERQLSFKLGSEFYSAKDFGHAQGLVSKTEGGVGASFLLGAPNALGYAFGTLRFEAAPSLSRGYRWGPGSQVGFLFRLFEYYKLHLSGEVFWDAFQNQRQSQFYRLAFEQSYSLSQNLELRTNAYSILPDSPESPRYSEFKMQLNYYF